MIAWEMMASTNPVYSFLNVPIEEAFWKFDNTVLSSSRDITPWFNAVVSATDNFVRISWICFYDFEILNFCVL